MTDNLDDPQASDRRLCTECVGDSFLKEEVRKNGRNDVCFYCLREGVTFSIAEIAERVDLAIDQHFYLTPTDPSGLEYAMIKEGDLDWERRGDPVVDVIQEYAEVEPEPASDIQAVLEDRYFNWESAKMGEENPFGKVAHYARAAVDDSESQAGWLHFEQSLKTEARFFSRTAEWTLQSIFEGISDHRTRDGRPVVVGAGPGTNLEFVYRARVFQSDEKLEEALKRPDIGIGPPPAKIATAGRMNAPGISVFYCATGPTIALAEVRPPVASRVVVGRFEIMKPVRLLDVEALRTLNVGGSIFDPDYRSRREKAKFLQWLSHRISMPVMPDDELFDYLATQAIADFLASNANPLLHGIIYPSVQGGEGRSNVAIFHKAARVQPMDLPEGTEISASLYDHTEDGREVRYWVSEEVPPARVPSLHDGDSFDFPFTSEPLDRPPEQDYRELWLKLDVNSLQVHHIVGVSFEAESHSVTRHRFEKSNRKF